MDTKFEILKIRFSNKYTISDSGCWVWNKPNSAGYGYISYLGKPQPAHRISYEIFNGPIPDKLHIDHLCRNRACVNPEHLEAVTQVENTLRGYQSRGKKTWNSPGKPLRSVRVSDDLWTNAQTLAKANSESLTDVIVRSLQQYLEQADNVEA